ncbi:MAG: DsbA family protein [Patescibacteria group bacterium]
MEKLKKLFKENSLSIFALLVMGGIVYLAVSQSRVPKQVKPAIAEPPGSGQLASNPNIDGWPFLGNPDAKVVFVEFGDYQCGFCGRFNQETLPELKEKYIDTGKIKFVYKDFVIFGEISKLAAQAAHCAGDQGKFFEYHDEIFNNQADGLNSELLKNIASDLGLNSQEFDSCLDSGKYADKVDQSTNEGISFGIEGTPTSFINGQPVLGAQGLSAFETIIDPLLESN